MSDGDDFVSRETSCVSRLIVLFLGILVGSIIFTVTGCTERQSVVVYAAQDQIFAEEIFRDFTKETGIQVKAVFDSEAVKTVGIANRLLAEKDHPQCDLFWSNEELRTRQLAANNAFRETNGWAAFGYRSRRVVVNPQKLRVSKEVSFTSITNKDFEGKVALAYPLFGTTATYFLALRQHWGAENWEHWLRALAANKPRLVDGNSVVVKFVGQGESTIGLTDSDDIYNGKREGLTLEALPISNETLLIPNTVAVTRGAPHAAAAEKLFQYLQSPAVTKKLVDAGALEGASRSEVTTPTLSVDWDKLLSDIEPATKTLEAIFVR